jgi:hypothetical protein
MLMRVLGTASLVSIIVVAGVAGAITLRGGDAASVTETSAGNVALHQEGKAKQRAQRLPRPLAPSPVRVTTIVPIEAADSQPRPAPVTPSVAAPKFSQNVSSLGQGRTTLSDSIFAVRSGDSVTVNFDTKGNRTGRADKFEHMLRETLPLVYGRRNTASIDSVPAGSLLPSRDVLGELTLRGMHLTLDNGLKVALWPQTRPTSDGPLVVAYILVVEK